MTDIFLQRDNTLSEEGEVWFAVFREKDLCEYHSDRNARIVFSALDRRNALTTAAEMDVLLELFIDSADICHMIEKMRSDSWVGSFSWFVTYGQHDPDLDDTSQPIHIERKFEDLGEFARYAQKSYEDGSSMEDAYRWAEDMKENVRKTRGSLGLSGDSSSSSDDLSPSIVGKEKDVNSASEETDKVVQSLADSQISKKTVRSNLEFMHELNRDFGSSSLSFFSIDYGLTGLIDATESDVFESLSLAMKFKYRLRWESNKSDDKHSWFNSTKNTDVMVIALSYKHQSKSERMTPQTLRKISHAICLMAKNRGMSKVNIWLDAILCVNDQFQNEFWAVKGIYPYLSCHVLRVMGKDDQYSDDGGMSMCMKVEEECADGSSVTTLYLDDSDRGYHLKTDVAIYSNEKRTIKNRMMDLARSICQGMLIGLLASWAEDKKNLIIWAELCMLQNTPVAMDDEDYASAKALRIDNMTADEITLYLEQFWSHEFMSGSYCKKNKFEEMEWCI